MINYLSFTQINDFSDFLNFSNFSDFFNFSLFSDFCSTGNTCDNYVSDNDSNFKLFKLFKCLNMNLKDDVAVKNESAVKYLKLFNFKLNSL